MTGVTMTATVLSALRNINALNAHYNPLRKYYYYSTDEETEAHRS